MNVVPAKLVPLGLPVILAGCSSVTVRHPIGEVISEKAEDVSEKLDGTWANEEGDVVQLKYLSEGKLRLASLDWDDEKKRSARGRARC